MNRVAAFALLFSLGLCGPRDSACAPQGAAAPSLVPGAHRAPSPEAAEHLSLVRRHLLAGESAQALAAARRAAEVDSLSSTVHEVLGIAYQAAERPREAYAAFRRATLLDPTAVTALNRAGQVLLTRLGRAAGARAAFEQALAIHAGYAAAHYSLSAYHLLRGEIEDTEREADLALDLAPEEEQGTFFGARLQLLMVRGRYAEAEDALRRHLFEMPSDRRSQQARALALRALGRHAEAAEALDSLLAQVRPEAVLLNELGMARLSLGRVAAAESSFAAAWGLDSTAIEAGCHMALARLAAGDTSGALGWLGRVEERDRGWYPAALLAGRLLAARGDAGRARLAFERARRLHPVSLLAPEAGGSAPAAAASESLLVRSEQALLDGDFGIALQLAYGACLDRSLRPRALLLAAWASRPGGSAAGGRVAQLEAALENAPSGQRSLRAVLERELGLAQLRLANREDARAHMERALAALGPRDPISAPACAALLRLHLDGGDLEAARALARRVPEGTGDAELLAELARVAEAAGEAGRAQALRERAEQARIPFS